jgi:hypothetical protein
MAKKRTEMSERDRQAIADFHLSNGEIKPSVTQEKLYIKSLTDDYARKKWEEKNSAGALKKLYPGEDN